MFEIQNRRIIRKLSSRSIKENKGRSLFVVFAIILTTYVLTTIFSIGISYLQSHQRQKLQTAGMDIDAEMNSPTKDQVETAQKMNHVKYAGVQVKCAKTQYYNSETLIRMTMTWRDEVSWEKQSLPAFDYFTGTYPQAEDEVVMSEWALKECGITDYDIGMELPILYADLKGQHEKTFKLAGYYKDYTEDVNPSGGIVLVSKAFMQTTGYKQTDLNAGRLFLTFQNELVTKSQLQEIEDALHLSKQQVFYADDEMMTTYLSTVIGILLLSALITFCGYLLIFNVLNISVSSHIRFYGLLKTTGVTSRQIKRMIWIQVLILSCIGIMIGLLAGGFTSFLVVPSLLGAMSDYLLFHTVSFHPIIFIGAMLFAFLTTILGSFHPAKMAGSIEPIEAVNYIDKKKYKSRKKRTSGGKLYRMALYNIALNKKKAAIVILSLFIGVTTFLTVTIMVKGNDIYNYIEMYQDSEISLNNETGMSEDFKAEHLFDDKFMEQLSDIKGIEVIETISSEPMVLEYDSTIYGDYLKEFYKKLMYESYEDGLQRIKDDPSVFQAQLVGISEGIFDMINQELDHPLDKEAFMSGEVCIMETTPLVSAPQVIGADVSFYFPDLEDKQTYTMKVGAGYQGVTSRYGGISPNIIVSDKMASRLLEKPWIEKIDIMSETSFDRVLDNTVYNMVKDNSAISYDSKIHTYDSLQSSITILMVFGSGISIILASIGLLNFINVMITGIFDRKKELAMFESIGMTSKQLKKMLLYEGVFYALASILCILVFGTLISIGIFQFLKEPHMVYRFPYVSMTVLFVVMIAVCIAVPSIILRVLDKSNLVEKLK